MRIKFIQKLIDKLRGKKVIDDTNYDYDNIQYKNIIVTKGFFYSGSSAVLGLLEEFDNTFVYGNHDNFFSKTKKTINNCGNEITWFLLSGIFDVIQAFKSNELTKLEKDIIIKRFIKNVYRGYSRKMISDWDKAPNFFNSVFLEVSEIFLKSILNFNKQDLEILETKPIPWLWQKLLQEDYVDCSFVHGTGYKQYLIYEFRNITEKEFDNHVSKYFHRLLNNIKFGGKEILVQDQLIDIDQLDIMNQYMNDTPLKQICVYRDPRDHFISLIKNDHRGIMPRTIDGFEEWFRNKIPDYVFEPHPHRLVIRFEDLVLNYEETINKIFDFTGLKKENHIAPKSVFDPSISVVNIGMWKDFYDQDLMKQIEKRLGKYCYYEEKDLCKTR